MILSAAGGMMDAKGQQQQAAANNAIAQYNATLLEGEATETRNQAAQAMTEEALKGEMAVGEQRAAAAARGATVDFGTAADLQEETRLISRANQERISTQAEDRASALETEAQLKRLQGELGVQQGDIGAMASMLSTAGTVADKWYSYNN
jgi:hypothetical protein